MHGEVGHEACGVIGWQGAAHALRFGLLGGADTLRLQLQLAERAPMVHMSCLTLRTGMTYI